jgi:hypothetical protein
VIARRLPSMQLVFSFLLVELSRSGGKIEAKNDDDAASDVLDGWRGPKLVQYPTQCLNHI